MKKAFVLGLLIVLAMADQYPANPTTRLLLPDGT